MGPSLELDIPLALLFAENMALKLIIEDHPALRVQDLHLHFLLVSVYDCPAELLGPLGDLGD